MMQIRALGLDDLLSLLALYGQLHPQDSVRPSGAVARPGGVDPFHVPRARPVFP